MKFPETEGEEGCWEQRQSQWRCSPKPACMVQSQGENGEQEETR